MTNINEFNFDGLVGPTHNYSGLAHGNLASKDSKGLVSNPKRAALQGLSKMRAVLKLGSGQGALPPQERPSASMLHALGFGADLEKAIVRAAEIAPDLLSELFAASSMWTANAATVTPSVDAPDGRVHFTPANLAANFHRSLEAPTTARLLQHIFASAEHFVHHPTLPGGVHMGDEGAANHGRLARTHADKGAHLFVYGIDGAKFRARQQKRASEAVARQHGLDGNTVFAAQSAAAIDAGAFHNDVVSVLNEYVLFTHEQAFENPAQVYDELRKAVPQLSVIEVPASKISLERAVATYLFNSQLITLPSGEMALILPKESADDDVVRSFIDELIASDTPISAAHYFDLRESMGNGGGPACLRLRVLLNESERAAVRAPFILDDQQISALEMWVSEHYRDQLAPDDLRDPEFARESLSALDALTQVLDMGAFYDFQR